jgi:hypothetical protein
VVTGIPPDARHFIWRHVGGVAVEPREVGMLPRGGNGHVGEIAAGAHQAPELGGRKMAEDRMFAAGQDRGQPESATGSDDGDPLVAPPTVDCGAVG